MDFTTVKTIKVIYKGYYHRILAETEFFELVATDKFIEIEYPEYNVTSPYLNCYTVIRLITLENVETSNVELYPDTAFNLLQTYKSFRKHQVINHKLKQLEIQNELLEKRLHAIESSLKIN